MTSLVPDYLIVICEFTYSSQGKTRYLPNDVRRFLMGKAHQEYEEGERRPGLPEKLSKELESNIISPIYFSLIKYPTKYSRAALGAIVIYHVSTADEEFLRRACKIIEQELQRKKFNEVKILMGFEVRQL